MRTTYALIASLGNEWMPLEDKVFYAGAVAPFVHHPTWIITVYSRTPSVALPAPVIDISQDDDDVIPIETKTQAAAQESGDDSVAAPTKPQKNDCEAAKPDPWVVSWFINTDEGVGGLG